MHGRYFGAVELSRGKVALDYDDDYHVVPGTLVVYPRCSREAEYVGQTRVYSHFFDLSAMRRLLAAPIDQQRRAWIEQVITLFGATGRCECGGGLRLFDPHPDKYPSVMWLDCERARSQRGLPDPVPGQPVREWPHEVVPTRATDER